MTAAATWRAEVLVPTHRMVFALRGGEVVELRASSTHGTFGAYRGLPDAVHGMIAWPNTVLLTGPRTIVVDPGYATQGDMLEGALRARGIEPGAVDAALATHLHSDHVSALPQLGEVELHVHEIELGTPHAHAGRGFRDRAAERPLRGERGEILPGLRWILTPGHTDGHVAFLVDADEGVVAIAGDTPGPDPGWFARGELPEGFPGREETLASFRAIRAERPAILIPGHNPPQRL
ncbi:MBL fold metallo-hydrolase [Miltoncostaea marina]|uniref:MBL fold metallo-hydrolase n=1 Tax=Miltoncostaea marina TaxID=2843215 RepID=UPI001C3CDD67|nr:MBL fold metallo-hydrolase [Miltoncostaea marina]